MRAAILLLPIVALAGCDEPADQPEKGADISIVAHDDNRKEVFTANAEGDTGRVRVSTPIFSADFKLPKLAIGAEDFDIGGVKLYPGSTVARIAVDANDNNRDDATVDVDFTSPAKADVVRDWFVAEFKRRDVAVEVGDDAIVGTTAEGNDFVIAVKDGGDGVTEGAIHIKEKG